MTLNGVITANPRHVCGSWASSETSIRFQLWEPNLKALTES